jgi:hypothetical protein
MQPGPSAVGRGRRRAAPPRRRRCWLDLPAGCWSSQVGWDIHALLCQLFTRVERDSLRRPPLHTTSRSAAPAVAGALSPAVL